MDNPENKNVRWWIQHFREFNCSKIFTPIIVLHVWTRDTESEEQIIPKTFIEEVETSFQYGSEPCFCWPHLLESSVIFHLYITL